MLLGHHAFLKSTDGSGGKRGEASHAYVEHGVLFNVPVYLFVLLLRCAPSTEWDWASAGGCCPMKPQEPRKSGGCRRLDGKCNIPGGSCQFDCEVMGGGLHFSRCTQHLHRQYSGMFLFVAWVGGFTPADPSVAFICRWVCKNHSLTFWMRCGPNTCV